jgi:hypothetical protein
MLTVGRWRILIYQFEAARQKVQPKLSFSFGPSSILNEIVVEWVAFRNKVALSRNHPARPMADGTFIGGTLTWEPGG